MKSEREVSEFVFLIHRVELKVQQNLPFTLFLQIVSNSPCGVESPELYHHTPTSFSVSNSPCGVESHFFLSIITYFFKMFLIHRVELKVSRAESFVCKASTVSNSPCGVESVFNAGDFAAGEGDVSNSPCGVESA